MSPISSTRATDPAGTAWVRMRFKKNKVWVEADAAGRQPLHVRRAVVVVQRITLRLARGAGQERQRRVHHAHVVDQEDDDVGRRFGGRRPGKLIDDLGLKGTRLGGAMGCSDWSN